MYEEDYNGETTKPLHGKGNRLDDEGGLHAPPDLKGWARFRWWFHFLILVNLARFRFIAILIVIGAVIMKWDTLAAYYDRWTRPAEAAHADASDVEYFCPMHPSVVRDNPKDKCPICFMPLSKRKKGQQTVAALPAGVVNRVQLSPYRVVLAGVQTWAVDYVSVSKEIQAVGYVEFNERGQRTITARVAGRIDKLFANETGQMLKAGDDLALVYSPELVVSMDSLLQAKRRGEKDFAESARIRLERLGIDQSQIDEIAASGKPTIDLRIRSPFNGHVIKKYIDEGQSVQEGAPLYDIADLSTVWVQAQVYEDDLAFLSNQFSHALRNPNAPPLEVTAMTRAFPDQPFHGTLTFIYPHVDQESRTVTVRFEIDNPEHKLRPGSTATISIHVGPESLPQLVSAAQSDESRDMLKQGKALVVPENAVIDTGAQRVVYRESAPGVYEGVEVKLGPRMSDDHGATVYPLLSGLSVGDKLVASGSFLVDAETRLNPAAGSIYFGGSSGSKTAASSVNVRPSTPDDPAAKNGAASATEEAEIKENLGKLAAADRTLSELQRKCPITNNRLGSMGVPVKVMLDGKPVFLCCDGCQEEAEKDAKGTLEKVERLKQGGSDALKK